MTEQQIINQKIIKTDVVEIGDPFVLLYEGKYYMYATTHRHAGGIKPGFKVWVSDDMVKWEDKGLCYYEPKWGFECFWAPEVYYHEGKFFMYFSAKWSKNKSMRTGIAVADSPLGRFEDVDGQPMDFGYAAIDGSVLIDDDGKKYFYYAKDCSENIVDGKNTSQIWVVRLKDDMITTEGEHTLVSTPDNEWELMNDEYRWNEGPVMLKRDGLYYLFYSSSPFWSPNYSVNYSTSKSPFGPFVKAKENPILVQIPGEISGPGHNAFFETKGGQLMTCYHIHTNMDKPDGNRRACFSKMYFRDGLAVIDYK